MSPVSFLFFVASCFFLEAASAVAQTNHDNSYGNKNKNKNNNNRNVQTFASVLPHPNRHHHTRDLEKRKVGGLLSERSLQTPGCIQDTMSLYLTSPALQAIAGKFSAQYSTAVEGCGDSSNTCVIDENTFQATPGFIFVCENAGGKIYEYDMIVHCVSTDGTLEQKIDLSYLNMDECYSPQSCDSAAIAQDIRQSVNGNLDVLESVFSNEQVVTLCNAEITISDRMGNNIDSERIDHTSLQNTSGATATTFVMSGLTVGCILWTSLASLG